MREIPPDVIYLDLSDKIGMSIVDTVIDEESIRQSVLYVLGTRKRSRKWRPEFGSTIAQYLFDPFDETTAGWISTYARIALEDPNNGLVGIISEIAVTVEMAQDQTYLCTVLYTIPELVKRDQIRFAMRMQG